MVKKQSIQLPADEPASLTIIQLRCKDSTVQSAVSALASVFSGGAPSNGLLQRAVPIAPPSLPSPRPTQNGSELEPEVVEATCEEVTPAARPAGKRSDRRVPKVLGQIDQNSGEITLPAFLAKCPPHDIHRYIWIAYWLKHHHRIEEIGVDHVHTCYRFMNWTTPKDAAAPLRDLKRKKYWLDKGGLGFYKINKVGESEVSKAIGAAE